MNHESFSALVQETFNKCSSALSSKGAEYSSDTDKLHNFRRAAAMQNCTPEEALIGMLAKHWVSILDIVDGIGRGKVPAKSLTDEKIGDSLNYLILLKALIEERHEKAPEGLCPKCGYDSWNVTRGGMVCAKCGWFIE